MKNPLNTTRINFDQQQPSLNFSGPISNTETLTTAPLQSQAPLQPPLTKRYCPINTEAYGYYTGSYKPDYAVDRQETSQWFIASTRGEILISFPSSEYINSIEFTASTGLDANFEYTIEGNKLGELPKIIGKATRFIRGGWARVEIEPIVIAPTGWYDQIKIICESINVPNAYASINEIYLQ
ncbi:hypothetical protein AWU65_18480 [Paenibacillus glucanolyticus]|uniref:Uncharacterized protein n=2 Tax=Paenibacillus glucanolyticus TaxID=59843 RepID=A0A163L300_9BACL|nr:hypothetical protein AWU65_18480 [Paenibacillus glucanolyticus]